MKPLYKVEQFSTPLKLDRPIVDLIDEWAGKLSMTRSGMMRLLIRVGGPIIKTMVDVMTVQLKDACSRVRENPLFFHLLQIGEAEPCAITFNDARRPTGAASANGNTSGPGSEPHPATAQRRRRQKISRATRPKGQADPAAAGRNAGARRRRGANAGETISGRRAE